MNTETITPTTQEVKTLSSFDFNKAELTTFIADYQNLVVNEETFQEAKKAREVIRQKRYAIQAQQKKNDDQRIAWNKSELASNKSNAEELIAILEPTELLIDKGIKAIEEVKEAEKQAKLKADRELMEARAKLIIATGALFTGTTYVLNHQYIDTTELLELPEAKFDTALIGFQEEAAKIQAEKDAEAKRIADQEAEKEAAAAKVAADLKADQEKLAEDKRVQEKKEADFAAEQKRLSTEAHNNRLAAEKVIADEKAELEEERKKVIEDKQALLDEKIKQRKTSLFALGMAANGNNFLFHECEIWLESIIDSTDVEWSIALDRVTNEISLIKARIAKEAEDKKAADAKAFDEAEAALVKKIEALRPDKEKLQNFIKSLSQITGPEVQSKEALGILEMALSQLKDTIRFVEISIAAI